MNNKKIQKRIDAASDGNEALEQLYCGSDVFFAEVVLSELERLNWDMKFFGTNKKGN